MISPILSSINHQPTEYTPIWLMRQAGRYLPEYRAVRANAGSFLNLCKNPELATLVTLQPLKRFALDAAILFSDILVIPEAMGMELNFVENEGPKFSNKIMTEEDVDNLDITEIIPRLDYVFAAIKNCKSELNSTPLIGFSGSPFTLACYMIEGGSSSNYINAKRWLYNNPTLAHKLLDKLSNAIIKYLIEQINSGVDIVMLFDSWGGILTDAAYLEFSLPYLQKIINAIPKTTISGIKLPRIVFTKGGGLWLNQISIIGADVIGLDWTINIGEARKVVPSSIALQGNLDPVLLAIGDRDALKKEVRRILSIYKAANQLHNTGHIFNLGHGVLPITNPDNVAYLVDLVHELSRI
jgi:uroporphyrinogen decarboxylase